MQVNYILNERECFLFFRILFLTVNKTSTYTVIWLISIVYDKASIRATIENDLLKHKRDKENEADRST